MSVDPRRYPVGPQPHTPSLSEETIYLNIFRISALPEKLIDLMDEIPADLWENTYRQDGWNICQLVNHIADSHTNAYVRTKWCLTESSPTIKPYDENAWSRTTDGMSMEMMPVSLGIIKHIHHKWIHLLKSLDDSDWERPWTHPAIDKALTLAHITEIYSWHGEHHLEHIKIAAGLRSL